MSPSASEENQRTSAPMSNKEATFECKHHGKTAHDECKNSQRLGWRSRRMCQDDGDNDDSESIIAVKENC